jgi:hypothetical protein
MYIIRGLEHDKIHNLVILTIFAIQ